MTPRSRGLATALAFAGVATLAVPLAAEAKQRRERHFERPPVAVDCRPYNGPYGYYGNPYCDGGFLTLEEQEDRYARGIRIYEGDRRWYRWR